VEVGRELMEAQGQVGENTEVAIVAMVVMEEKRSKMEVAAVLTSVPAPGDAMAAKK